MHSKIVQRKVGSPSDTGEFDKTGADGSIPLVLVPRQNCCCYCCLNIPSGVFVLWQRWSAHMGLHPPGLIVCWPAWNHVSHVVSRATKTYNAPVQNCPTADNVMVSVDVSISFQVQDAEKFVYLLGAHRLDEFLSAHTDEAIRGLVYEVASSRVLDLREEFAFGMLSGLNTKVNPYGIAILNVKITNVILPGQLAQTLEKTTSFQTQMEQQEKAHSARMRVLLDDAKQTLTKIKKSNERKVQDLLAAQQRALISREEQLISAKTSMEVAILDCKSQGNVAKTNANSEKENMQNTAERLRVEAVGAASAEAKAAKLEKDQDVLNVQIKCAAELKEAEARAKAILVQGKVEEEAAKQLVEKRSFELQSLQQDVMQKIAAKGSMVFSGDVGEQLLKNIAVPVPSTMSR